MSDSIADYKMVLKYLFAQLPMFHRIGAAAYKADLNNTNAIMKLLKHPHKSFKTIHVAGTNGKGSVSHMLAAVLQKAGYKTGLYTSPHLKDFRERIRINGKMISRKYVVDFVNQYKDDFEKIQPSFFEWTVGLAFDYFRNQQVDFAIIETGLGGRLDSTNVINPLLSVITNISYDHQNLLGNTLEKIAAEKAGIIKPKGLVLIGEKQNSVKHIFEAKAKAVNATLKFAADYCTAKSATHEFVDGKLYLNVNLLLEKKMKLTVPCDLPGLYQQKNICTVIAATMMLEKFNVNIPVWSLINGIMDASKISGLLGRWQILQDAPLTIADTAHNQAGIKEVLKQIKITPHQHLHFVLGMVNDKDIKKILSLLTKDATYYFCKANIPRGLDATLLQQQATNYKLNGTVYSSVKKALAAAKEAAKKTDMIFIGGSNFTVAEVV